MRQCLKGEGWKPSISGPQVLLSQFLDPKSYVTIFFPEGIFNITRMKLYELHNLDTLFSIHL